MSIDEIMGDFARREHQALMVRDTERNTDEAKQSLWEEIERCLPETRLQFLSEDRLRQQLDICEGRKQMLNECRTALKNLILGDK